MQRPAITWFLLRPWGLGIGGWGHAPPGAPPAHGRLSRNSLIRVLDLNLDLDMDLDVDLDVERLKALAESHKTDSCR